ncbi:MAG: hypothetical protein JO097_10995 [Acidobacteriaceae bacterium]|nr:hypothetical protein [Acidobacteriaceae bacterium]MBV9767409.1 hypothetical protein [Acidobacteriaceae bacterium]
MELSSLVKVIAAFIAGVVVALGSALIYVRVNESVHPRPVTEAVANVQPASVTQPAPQPAEPDASDQQPANETSPPPPPEPAEKPHPKKLKPLMEVLGSRRHATPARTSLPEQAHNSTVEIAQNSAPPVPETTRSIPGVNLAPPAIPGVNPSPAPVESSPAPEPAPESIPTPAPQPAPKPAPKPHVVTLQAGANLVIRLGETLSTDHNYTGDTFRASLESPIVMDGFIIAEKGSKVLGRIVNAQKAPPMGGVADLNLILTEINTTDGQRVRIETSSFDKRGSASTGEDAAKIAGGAALGAIIGGIAGGGKGAAIGAGAGGAAGTGAVLVMGGKPAVLPTETRLTFHLASPVTITEKLNN